jgi:SulP family sulfate permease
VGLIFLSAIASGVVDECERAGVGAADTLGTVLAALAAATALVGGLIVATGRLRLASIVQYCPLPVVGGYLSYVGFFVLCSGVSLASGVAVTTPRSWTGLADTEALLRLLPAVAMAGLLTLVLRRCRSPYALPALLLAVPLAFYGLLAAGGWTLEDARRGGWVAQPQPDDSDWRFWRMYELYNVHSLPPSNLHWRALPPQAGKLLALYFVVAFGSSMDIAAIQVGDVGWSSAPGRWRRATPGPSPRRRMPTGRSKPTARRPAPLLPRRRACRTTWTTTPSCRPSA